MFNNVICDEGDCTDDALFVLACGESTRRVCPRHHKTAVRDLKFLHPGERIDSHSGSEAVRNSVADARIDASLRRLDANRRRATEAAPPVSARQAGRFRRGRR